MVFFQRILLHRANFVQKKWSVVRWLFFHSFFFARCLVCLFFLFNLEVWRAIRVCVLCSGNVSAGYEKRLVLFSSMEFGASDSLQWWHFRTPSDVNDFVQNMLRLRRPYRPFFVGFHFFLSFGDDGNENCFLVASQKRSCWDFLFGCRNPIGVFFSFSPLDPISDQHARFSIRRCPIRSVKLLFFSFASIGL